MTRTTSLGPPFFGDWTTYHGDNLRTGSAGPSYLTNASLGWKSSELDGAIYAEPLVFGGRVFVVTENDSIYALDSSTGQVVWRTHLGDPVPRSVLPCGNIDPTGITGTPVIDPGTKTIYAVAFEMPGKHFIAALNTQDGAIRFSVSADPAGADPFVQQQRGALTFGNGKVYIPFGGLFGDCGAYHGWVVGVNADGTGTQVTYQVPTAREGGIWAPSGGVLDPQGNLFFATGNGESTNAFDHGNSVVELSPGLQELGYFAPSNWLQLNQGDTDLGSSGPAFVAPEMLFQIGKEGVGYLLNSSALGGIGGETYSGNVCSSSFGGTANAGGVIFVPCSDGLVKLKLTTNSFQIAWQKSGFNAGPPVITGNEVWTVDTASGTLLGFNLNNGLPDYAFHIGATTRFETPAVGEGRLFVAAGARVVAFQLA
jgi:outer membrane protein assembly factor BamB